jgi:hypothetical protein
MAKFYFLLVLIAGGALVYVFFQDPCNQLLRADFSSRYPTYKILDSGAQEGSPESVSCHIYYKKPDGDQVYEDIWMYLDSGNGWEFSKVLKSGKRE